MQFTTGAVTLFVESPPTELRLPLADDGTVVHIPGVHQDYQIWLGERMSRIRVR